MTSWVIVALPVLLLAAVLALAFIGCGFTPGSGETYSSAVSNTAGLVAYWRLDDQNVASGSPAKDSADAHDGVYQGAVTLVDGLIVNQPTDQAVQLDGQTGYVSVPYDAALNSPQFSVEAWVKPDGANAGNSQAIVSALGDPQTNKGYGIYIGADDKWQFWYGDDTTFDFIEYDQNPVFYDLTTHVVATYDGTTTTLWVDAFAAAEKQVSITPSDSGEVRIGAAANYDPAGEFLSGVIDEVAIYNRALSEADVHNHFGIQGETP